MKIQPTKPVYNKIQQFSTNGVLRCISGEFLTGKPEQDIKNTSDIISTVRKVFNYTDNDITSIVEQKNFLGAFIVPIGAGRYLEDANPLLKSIRNRLMQAKEANNIDGEIEKIIKEVGEHINLNI